MPQTAPLYVFMYFVMSNSNIRLSWLNCWVSMGSNNIIMVPWTSSNWAKLSKQTKEGLRGPLLPSFVWGEAPSLRPWDPCFREQVKPQRSQWGCNVTFNNQLNETTTVNAVPVKNTGSCSIPQCVMGTFNLNRRQSPLAARLVSS